VILLIWDVLGSNLGSCTGYLDIDVRGLPHSLKVNTGCYLMTWHGLLFPLLLLSPLFV
jgi:hypothetical protein